MHASFYRNTHFFFFFFFPCTFTFYFLESRLYLRHHVPSCTFHRARVLAYATFTRMPFERVARTWNSMGTCAYGDGRVTCLPSGPCKHETTLVVSKRRERRSLSSLISPVLLHIYNVYSTPFATLPSNTHFEGTVPSCKPWENETKRNERVKWIRFIKPNPNVRAMCTNKVSSIIGTLQEDDWFK